MIVRTAALVVGLSLLAPTAFGQPRFELGGGPQYGLQRNPMTPGWLVSGGFEIDGQEFVVEGGWSLHERMREIHDRWDPWDEYPGSETARSFYLTMAAGIRGGLDQEKRFSPFYQLLVGGLMARHRTDYDWTGYDAEEENRRCGGYGDGVLLHPCVRYPEYEEEKTKGFLMQPGVGMDVRVAGAVKARLALDLMVLAHRDWGMTTIPRMSLQAIVAF